MWSRISLSSSDTTLRILEKTNVSLLECTEVSIFTTLFMLMKELVFSEKKIFNTAYTLVMRYISFKDSFILSEKQNRQSRKV